MDIIYKVLITMLSIIILLSTGLSLTLGIANEIETNYYFTSVTETIVDSNYNEDVIDLLIKEAEEKGYALSVKMFGSTIPGSYKYAEITLSYDFHLDLFDIVLHRKKQKIV